RWMRTLPLLPVVLAAALAVSGCGLRTNDGGRPHITAAFYPLAWLATQVGGPAFYVENLTKPGAEPHDLERTPRQVIDVGEPKLAFYIKGVQPAVNKAVHDHAKHHSLDAESLVSTLPAPRDEANDGAADPHLWLDPVRFAHVATVLGERLAQF